MRLIIIFIIIFFFCKNSISKEISLIRDSETEDFLLQITKPLAKAANLNIEDLKIYIVNDQNINAFVAGGQNIFVNTGLITKFKDVNVLSGVLSHELGHIAAAHIAKSNERMKDINKMLILSYLAGIAAAMTSNSDAGYAILSGSNHIANRIATRFTRTQEEAADKLALEYLYKTNNTPLGLMQLLLFLSKAESEYIDLIDEYALTHPVSKKRVSFIKANLDKFNQNININSELAKKKDFITAKLESFLNNGDKTLKKFNSSKPSDIYARSIAYFKKGNVSKSIEEIDKLIKEEPKNGYFHELKGQILYENSLIKEAIKSYEKAIKFLPNPTLAKISLSSAILAIDNNDIELINFAIKNLNEALIIEKYNGQIYKQLAKAYKKIDKIGLSYLALAEFNLIKEDNKKTNKYANLALEHLNKNTQKTYILIANDILAIIDIDEN